MKRLFNIKLYKKIAFAFSLCMIVVWALLGTGASLAWFSDSDDVTNVINIADFDLFVSYLDKNGEYTEVKEDTNVFNDSALYEPGYVEISYLKVDNLGDIPFDFHTSVSVMSVSHAINGNGDLIDLTDYLKFGIVAADSEAELRGLLSTRDKAKAFAIDDINEYTTDKSELKPEKSRYLALIVYMPEDVDDRANYRGEIAPSVQLRLVVSATQIIK